MDDGWTKYKRGMCWLTAGAKSPGREDKATVPVTTTNFISGTTRTFPPRFT